MNYVAQKNETEKYEVVSLDCMYKLRAGLLGLKK
ncbi:hypothetical protein Psch_03853 [Pelotomaculum schinkii]|uniref:Uncharacterized protein n=1 Tax=Pelotomaculum schinkii TaxID=78350 RepID=A0A4Y7R672_9FIRM|nr:hypothetical protein Psch_03853 [Pelotomaculum schinkii]TEB17852.1 hypothetical protein Psfp_00347 [Pelotomaculum sp. FP]